jgi:DNA polymerase elongation subunit (family B)
MSAAAAVRYEGGSIPGLPTRAELARAGAPDLNHEVGTQLGKRRPVHFMPTDVVEQNKYVDGQPEHRMQCYGCLPDGSKAVLIIAGLPVYFDVRRPPDQTRDDFEATVKALAASAGAAPDRTEFRRARPVMGFHEQDVDYLRLHFATLQTRRTALRAIGDYQKGRYETAADDFGTTTHYRKSARDAGLPLTDWLVVSEYDYARGGAHPDAPPNPRRFSDAGRFPTCEHVLQARAGGGSEGRRGVRPLVDPLEGGEGGERQAEHKQRTPHLARDRTAVVTFDIETWTPHQTGRPPEPEKADDIIFMIALTFHWKDEKEPASRVCLVDYECAPDPEWHTVVCGGQAGIIRAFGQVLRAWAPDIVAGFNDGRYDWPFVYEKARQLGLLVELFGAASGCPRYRQTAENIEKFSYVRGRRVKLSADSNDYISHLKWPGAVPVDVRTCFRRLMPKAERTSLKHFLAVSGLKGKEDLPYKRLYQLYEAARAARTPEATRRAAEGLREAARYCIVDAQRCQELLVRRNVINDRREVGALSFVTLYDCLYYADAARVSNMLAAYACQAGLACSLQGRPPTESGKYPGAYVVPPEQGLEDERPVTGLDFASLYPSIMMTYNLSPEKYVEDAGEAARLRAAGRSLHYVSFDYGGQQVEGWFVRHDNRETEMGLFPSLLLELFNRRKKLKKVLKRYEARCERCDVLFGQAEADSLGAQLEPLAAELECAAEEAAVREAYQELSFRKSAVDAKQKALKVFMNTFYGVAGSSTAAFFLLPLAGGVTAAGRANLKLVYDFVTKRGYDVKYGDTDSLYVCCPPETYSEARRAWEQSDGSPEAYEEYCKAKVRATMERLKVLRDEVNGRLEADNGTRFLKMAYEEVLFPVVFVGKKKYYGIPHESEPNFRPRKLFIKGIDIKKQGQTGLAKTIGHRVLWESVKLRRPCDERPTLLGIVESVLREALTNRGQWRFDDFVQSDAYKPDKQNAAVQLFVRRMQERHDQEVKENERRIAAGEPPLPIRFAPPEPGERFDTVIVKKAMRYDLKGRMASSQRKGDKMEYADHVRSLPPGGGEEIDVPYYFSHYVVGLCARFVCHEFPPPGVSPPDQTDDVACRKYDDKCVALAKKHLVSLVGSFDGEERRRDAARRRAYQQAWRTASKALRAESAADEKERLVVELAGGPEEGELWLQGEERRARDSFAEAACQRAQKRAEELPLDLTGYARKLEQNHRRLYALSADSRANRRRRRQTESFHARRVAQLRERLAAQAGLAGRYWRRVAARVAAERRAHHAERPELGEPAAGLAGGGEDNEDGEDGENDEDGEVEELDEVWTHLVGLYYARRARQSAEELRNDLRARVSPAGRAPRANPADPVAQDLRR